MYVLSVFSRDAHDGSNDVMYVVALFGSHLARVYCWILHVEVCLASVYPGYANILTEGSVWTGVWLPCGRKRFLRVRA